VLMAPYYRNYQLAWESDPEEQERFRRLLLGGLALLLLFSIALAFIHIPAPKLSAEEAIPPRLARLMVPEKPKPPPVIPPKPEVKPEPKPAETPKPVDTRKKMEQSAQMRAIKDQLADLREQVDVTPLQARNLTGTIGAESKSERSLISSKVGSGSTAVVSADASRGFGAGAGSLNGHDAVGVTSRLAASIAQSKVERSGQSGKAARSPEEIELVFDKNKGAIYALYSRALRENPELQGKLVLEFTIAPSGDVTMCRVVSSELKDDDLERKIVARVKLFKFEARDVEPITTTKPIEFFPA